MRIDPLNLLAILGMAIATYSTRIAGLWVMRAMRPGPVLTSALDAMPVAVLTAVIAPSLVKGGMADLLAAAITIAAAVRLSLLATVAIGVASAVLLRTAIG